jgi:rhodanese-related sulfurtransferase
VPGSLHIGLNGQFASWAGTLVPRGSAILLVADGEDEVREATVRLARVGLERVEGYLEGGIAAWERDGKPLQTLEHVAVEELRQRLGEDGGLQVLDVRRPAEYASGHVPRAVNLPLDRLTMDPLPLDPAQPVAVVCEGGYRSSAAASILRRRGVSRIANVVGGTSAWVKAGYPVER